MVERNIPWAFTLGNHDAEGDLTASEIYNLDQEYPLSLTQRSTFNIRGTTNYVLPVVSSNGSTVAANLWFFDSNQNGCMGNQGWGCVERDQIEWYRAESLDIKETNNNTVVPALGFLHIPLPEVSYCKPFHCLIASIWICGIMSKLWEI